MVKIILKCCISRQASLGAATALIFSDAFVLHFHLKRVQRTSFCRCFLISNSVVLCVDDDVIFWLKTKNPTTNTTKCNLLYGCFDDFTDILQFA